MRVCDVCARATDVPPTRQQMRYDEEDEDEGPKADPTLEQGMPLPIRLNAVFPPELTAVPIEDIDPYYRNERVSPALIPISHPLFTRSQHLDEP